MAVACSQTSPHPPGVGDCVGPPSACVSPNTAGGGAGTGGSDGGTCGQLAFADPVCESCVNQRCCPQNTACSNEPDCLLLAQCASSCTVQSCVSACQNQYQNGVADYANFGDCVRTECTQCQPADAGAGCGQLVLQNATCQSCITQSCCTQALACSNNPDCPVLAQCLQTCQPTDQPCIVNCQNQVPNGSAAYSGLSSCMQTSCVGLCP